MGALRLPLEKLKAAAGRLLEVSAETIERELSERAPLIVDETFRNSLHTPSLNLPIYNSLTYGGRASGIGPNGLDS